MAGGRTKKDLYAIIGVARDAAPDEIKKAYRKLAQRYHPDRNADDASAEERFKEVSAANAVLSDPQRRKDYDEFGDVVLDPNFDADKAREASRGFGGADFSEAYSQRGGDFQDLGGFGSLFEDLFARGGGGGGRAARPRRGADAEVAIELDFLDAVRGSEQSLTLNRQNADGSTQVETLKVRIPPGVKDGGRIRLAGKGSPGMAGGPSGDLFAIVKIRAHPVFSRDGDNLQIEVPVSVLEAINGAKIDIPTLDGRVQLSIPPGTDGGARLRLRGKGVPAAGGRKAGDLYVTVRIRVPKSLDEAARAKLDELLQDDPAEWRQELFR